MELTSPLVTLFVISLVLCQTSGYGSRLGYPSLQDFLERWTKCSAVGESCSSNEDCCEDNKCQPTMKSFRGPKFACAEVPSRIYRHLIARPAGVEKSAIFAKEGDFCNGSTQCEEDLCCKTIPVFRSAPLMMCVKALSGESCL